MTLERFAALLDSYGAEPQRWPPAERAAAIAFAARSAAAGALLREAGALDALLDADIVAPASPAARRAVLAALPARPLAQRWPELLALLGGWRIALPALAMALVAGIDLGASAGARVYAAADLQAADSAEAIVDPAVSGYAPGFAESLLLGLQKAPAPP